MKPMNMLTLNDDASKQMNTSDINTSIDTKKANRSDQPYITSKIDQFC